MPLQMQREPQGMTAQEFLSGESGLPEKVELVRGAIGPYSDAGKLTLLANWGADEIIRITGPDVWKDALAVFAKSRKD